jgi:tRNA threonylcarbamoyladenosine biosynthesis protein TsaE
VTIHVETVASEAETAQLAQRLAPQLQAGDFLCLIGDLGAGKTTFARYLVAALGSPAPVSSPTFTLIHEYGGGRLPVIHMDAYRLRSGEDAESTGLGDYLAQGEAVFLVEWPERIAESLPETRLEILLEISLDEGEEDNIRSIAFQAHGARWAGLVL